MMIETAEISISGDEINTVITGRGILDLTNAQSFREELLSASRTAETLTVDLRSASFIDTAIMEYLARGAKEMLRREKRLKVIVAEGSHPQRVLRIAGFAGLMDIAVA